MFEQRRPIPSLFPQIVAALFPGPAFGRPHNFLRVTIRFTRQLFLTFTIYKSFLFFYLSEFALVNFYFVFLTKPNHTKPPPCLIWFSLLEAMVLTLGNNERSSAQAPRNPPMVLTVGNNERSSAQAHRNPPMVLTLGNNERSSTHQWF